MAMREFVASKGLRAVRKAVDFWYRSLRDRMSLVDFLSRCEWFEEDGRIVRLVCDSDRPTGKPPERTRWQC
jgi:hypothetical protein